eukprot:693005-Rhodomonas_salina.1
MQHRSEDYDGGGGGGEGECRQRDGMGWGQGRRVTAAVSGVCCAIALFVFLIYESPGRAENVSMTPTISALWMSRFASLSSAGGGRGGGETHRTELEEVGESPQQKLKQLRAELQRSTEALQGD